MSSTYSPTRSPSSSRMQLSGGPSRLRSSVQKKPPEPLRRAVADCLSPAAAGSHHGTTGTSTSSGAGNPASVVSEASRTLRDYLAAPSTMDLAYSVILEHTIAERDRSPAVVARCVAILKRYLLRYKPSEETLQQIDRFCMSTASESDTCPSRKSSPLSQTLSQRSGALTSTNSSPSLPVSSFASGALVKSLNYVRSLVAQHIPKRSFQPAAFAGGPHAPKQPLPSLSSLLSKSFNSQLSPVNSGDSSEKNDTTTLSTSTLSLVEKVDGNETFDYIAPDVLKWRWLTERQSSFISSDGDRVVNPQDMNTHNFLEVGAAALLVGDMEAKIKDQPWKHFGTADMPFLDQLLQPSPVTAVTDCELARPHLRAITASKRSKPNPRQIWDDSPISTFRPRARPLFQYRHYSEQQPLRLNPAEVSEVIAAVCSETSSANANLITMSSKLNNNRGKPTVDVAMSVLIKLVIDMYVMDSGTAAPLTLCMLEEMLGSPINSCRTRAFDLILNLGVHAHLLEPMKMGDASTIEEDYSQELYFDKEVQLGTQGKSGADSAKKMEVSPAIENLETWILNILYEILLLLVQIEEKEESVWASALSCLLYFICDRGQIMRSRLKGLDIRVIKSLIEVSRKNSWAEVVHSKLVCMLTNMFYQTTDGAADDVVSMPDFLIDQIDLIGGIGFIFLEYSLTNSREERRNLYLVLFDYVLHHINKQCTATGASEYSIEEIQLLGTMLTQADAPEAFYISVKLGVEGIGGILKRSISAALSRYPNSERLNMLLECITEKFDELISVCTHLDKEFSHLMQITKTYKFLKSVEDEILVNNDGMKLKLSWSTLHSLLHSERIAYRLNGYTWLGDLLIAEISERRDTSIWSNIKKLQREIGHAGVHEYSSASDVPLSVWLMCGLLKSKHNHIRWGFLFVLERLLMRCKFLLDENETKNKSDGDTRRDSRLEKANTVIDIMSSALSLVAQINETDRINILKMCDILFSQLCLKVPSTTALTYGDRQLSIQRSRTFSSVGESKRFDSSENISVQENCPMNAFMEEKESRSCHNSYASHVCETASMAALLLHGHAIVPMQLVARVPAALFYWPLIQLASAATDNIALGVAVGSKGRGNLPGATSDIRAALLLLLIGKCTANPAAFEEVGGEEFFRELLDDTDSRVAYYSSAFLLKRMMTEKPEKYQNMLQNLVFKAQQCNNEKLLENPYLQMRGILQLANDLGTEL